MYDSVDLDILIISPLKSLTGKEYHSAQMFANRGIFGKGIFIRMLNVWWCRNEFLWLQKALDRIGFGSLSSKKETGVILLLVNYQEIEGVEMHSPHLLNLSRERSTTLHKCSQTMVSSVKVSSYVC